MIYPGDTKNLVLSITTAAGTAPQTTMNPVVSVVSLSTLAIIVNSQPMTLLAGTQAVWYYAWNTTGCANGDYVAVVSYASDGLTINGRLLETLRLGDTNITGVVSLDATVAKAATVALDATVAHFTDLATISPDTSPTILSIQAKTNNLPVDPASMTLLTPTMTNVQNLSDYNMGTWTIDTTVNPQTLTILRPNGAILQTFQLTSSSAATARIPTS
jgi:hypothetical protein